MTLPAKPGRQIGRAIGLGAIVAVLTAGTVAFLLDASRPPAALPYGAAAGALIRSASTYLVLATVLFVCLLAAAFDLFRQMRRTLAALDAVADNTARIVAGDLSVRAVSRDGCMADLSRFIKDFNAMADQLKPVSALETRLEAIKGLVDEADASSRDALLHHVDDLFRFVDAVRVAEQPEGLTRDHRSTTCGAIPRGPR